MAKRKPTEDSIRLERLKQRIWPDKPKPPDANAQSIGTSAGRAVAISTGWSRSQAIIIVQAALITGVLATIRASKLPFLDGEFVLLMVGYVAGLAANITWFGIVSCTDTWVNFQQEKLIKLEKSGVGSPVSIYGSKEFSDINKKWGATETARLYSRVGLIFWGWVLWYIATSQYPVAYQCILERPGLSCLQELTTPKRIDHVDHEG